MLDRDVSHRTNCDDEGEKRHRKGQTLRKTSRSEQTSDFGVAS